MNEPVWTIQRLLDWTAEYFSKNGTAQPRLDAEILLAETLGCQRIDLYTRFDEEVADEPRGQFRGWVKRHAAGEPVAYLVGYREFFSLEFEVNSDVLIPRPETEHLVSETLDLVSKNFADLTKVRIVDVGTGSGCIAISIAKHCQRAIIDAIDISAAALEVARRNVEKHGVADRVRLCEGDLLDAIADHSSINIVVSNPPYVGQNEREQLAAEVRDFEPESALFASDPQGLTESQRLIELTRGLPSKSFLVMESSPMNIASIQTTIMQSGFDRCEVKKDLAGLQRWVVAQRA